jgi:hypothetical protein
VYEGGNLEKANKAPSIIDYVNGRLDNIHIITKMHDYELNLPLGSVWTNPLLILSNVSMIK